MLLSGLSFPLARAFLLGLTALYFFSQVLALGDTDTLTWGGDNTRAGYQAWVSPRQASDGSQALTYAL
jgi:hypothetical protein